MKWFDRYGHGHLAEEEMRTKLREKIVKTGGLDVNIVKGGGAGGV